MREILFRGKRIDNGEGLVSGTLLQNSDDERFCWMPVYGDKFGTAEDDKGNILRIEYGTLYRVDPATVGQYTGLKDKNGKRIFEGDIVKCSHSFITANAEEAEIKNPRKSYGKEIEKMTLGGFRCRYWRNYAVSFHDGRIRGQNGSDICYLKQSYIRNHEIEVIGNIHDNGVEELNGD